MSDITIGDFWGLNDSNFKNKDGNSVILTNTKKGDKFVIQLENLNLFEYDITCAIDGNAQLNKPTQKKYKAYIFKKRYLKSNFSKAVKSSIYGNILIGRLKEYLKIIRDKVKNK